MKVRLDRLIAAIRKPTELRPVKKLFRRWAAHLRSRRARMRLALHPLLDYISSQLRTALIFNKKTKARNYTLETVNKNIYIFGIAMNEEEKKEVINEANKIYDVEKVIPSIYLASELSRTKFN